MDSTQLLHAHMEDLARKAGRTGAAHSGFLSPAQAARAEAAWRPRKDVTLVLDGGFADAERRVAVFLQPGWGVFARDETLAALALAYRPQDTVRHKDVLGAVLGLGLSRDVLGDIRPEPGRATLVCLARTAGYILQQLNKVGRVGVSVQAVPLAGLPGTAPAPEERQLTVASLRLDAVVAAAFGCSRAAAAAAVAAGRVQLAHEECLNAAHPVRAGDIVALRGKGRVKVLQAQGLSRKGRQCLVVGQYGG